MPAELNSLLHQPLVLIGLAVAVWYFWPQIQAALNKGQPAAPPTVPPAQPTQVPTAQIVQAAADPLTMPVATVQQIPAPPVNPVSDSTQANVSQLLTAMHALTVVRDRLQAAGAAPDLIKQLDAMSPQLLTPIK